MRKLEIWGGVECTLNRVGNRFFDQTLRSGHLERDSDLLRFASLGIRTLRYPILWEQVEQGGTFHWNRLDRRLSLLSALGIKIVAGLVHHGSGPGHTDLLDDSFALKLAGFGEAVARRYPWIEYYTPINEPLTTARFSGLYGHWYPHHRNDRSFVRALTNQVRGITLSMKRIRQINPKAKLVFTEDLGTVYGSSELDYQVAFENHRRWLSLDLLCGTVNEAHPLSAYLRENGMSETDLAFFQRETIRPEVVGINHYVTSNRYLDLNFSAHPICSHGGNGQHQYADVAAVRALPGTEPCFEELLTEAWERYGIPVGLTEVHMGRTREEQIRWLQDAWKGAHDCLAKGVPVKALCAWALLGSYDWDSLVTESRGHYESGAFDMRSPVPRITAVGKLLRDYTTGTKPSHPLLHQPGWWAKAKGREKKIAGSAPILILGSTGTLGTAFSILCEQRGIPHIRVRRNDLDFFSPDGVCEFLAKKRPWAVVNATGFVDVDLAESQPDLCKQVNTLLPTVWAEQCEKKGAAFLTFSSDLVFDGSLQAPYSEFCVPNPLNTYGQSKFLGEQGVARVHPDSLIVRTSAFFGPWDQSNFLAETLRSVARNHRVYVSSDQIVTPTYVPDLVNASLDLLIDGEKGLWHLSNSGEVSWYDFARTALTMAGANPLSVHSVLAAHTETKAMRPHYSALTSGRGQQLPALSDALNRWKQALSLCVPPHSNEVMSA